MRFLSVAERELRAGARQKATHRIRWITAAVFLGLLAWLMWAFQSFRSPQIFQIFATLIFFYCLIIGTARTADCLSSEKREGTMGLLFLTNLNAFEIIGGKLCSNALAAAYGLFAIFPLLALQMLIGGITLGHFWRTVLALGNAILFSVAAGFLASSVCLRQFIAIACATGLALCGSVGLMGLATVANSFRSTRSWADGTAIFSPLYALVAAGGGPVFRGNRYWWSVLAVAGLSGTFLGLATWRVSRSWRDRATRRRPWSNFKILKRWEQHGQAGRVALRRRLLGINPLFWLGGRRRVTAPVFMLLSVIIVTVASFIAAPYFGRVLRAGTFSPMIGHLFAWFWAALAIHALVLYCAAMTASRRLAEDKQTGALELVLSTPTSEGSISRGLWMAYGRSMLFPATIAILIHFFFIWQGATMAVMDPPSTKFPPGTTPGELLWHALLNRPIGNAPLEWGFILALRIVSLALLLLILIWLTIGWLGRWLGLRMKHPGFAPMLSLALVLVPPVVLFSLAIYCAGEWNVYRLPQRIFIPMMMWIAFAIGAGNCLILSLWAAGHLRRDFRAIVTSRFQPPSLRPWWRPSRRRLLRFGIGFVAVPAALLIIVLSFYGFQNWRSRRAWSAFQNELKQRHESLDLAALLAGPVPQSQNFALTPAFRSWVDLSRSGAARRLSDKLDAATTLPPNGNAVTNWTQQVFAPLDDYLTWIAPGVTSLPKATRGEFADTVLRGLKPYDATLRGLADAARLPYFQTSTNRDALAVLHQNKNESAALERLHMLFQVRACAWLAASSNAEAAVDLLTGLQLVRLAQQITDSQSSTRAQVLLIRSLQPLWEGIVEQRWTEPQLAAFQNELGQFNLLADHTNAIRRVILAHIEIWRAIPDRKSSYIPSANTSARDDSFWQMQPRGWWFDHCMQLYRAGEIATQSAGARGRLGAVWSDLEGLPLDSETTFLLEQPYWGGAVPRNVFFGQTAVNQAIIACALDRYRLAHGRYPEKVEQLIPECLPTIPNDVVCGRPMLYQNENDGHFILRSVGPNGTDDRNKPFSDDWLWSFPTNAPSGPVR